MPLCPRGGFSKGVKTKSVPDSSEQSWTSRVRSSQETGLQCHATTDLSAVRADLRRAIRCPGHDDGSLAPLFIRLAWHCSGTYDRNKQTGGSNGATMRFETERCDPENAGLGKAREVIEKVHAKHSYLTLADIYILAGYVAFEATGGPVIPFAIGRKDFTEDEAREIYGDSLCPFGDGIHNPCGSRLPAADLGQNTACPYHAPANVKEKPTIDAIRGSFARMGLDDRETVLLIIMGHQYGRMHPEISGYEHTWYAFDPNHWNVYGPGGLGYLTAYAMQARNDLWPQHLNAKGLRQFSMRLGGGVFSMLPVDMALLWDPDYKKLALWYDRHRLEFHQDSALAWKKLTELECQDLVPETTPNHDRVYIEHIT